jgi:hypothetical protein
LIHFELFFLHGENFFYKEITNFSSTIYWRDCHFSNVGSCCLCQKSIGWKYMDLFWGSLLASNCLYICFYASTMWCGLLSLWECLEVRYCNASSFILSTQEYFATQNPLRSHSDFRGVFFCFCEECHWIIIAFNSWGLLVYSFSLLCPYPVLVSE